MIAIDDERLATRARYLTTQAKEPGEGGRHGEVGYNYRLTGLQASFGLAQLERLDELVAAKRRIAAGYANGLAGLKGISLMPEAAGATNAFWLYTIRIDTAEVGIDAETLGRRLAQSGIETRRFWQPMHLSKPHGDAPALGGEVSERLWRELLSLPSSCGLSEASQAQVIAAVRRELDI